MPDYLTFDCYGTLIEWEAGILNAVLPVLRSRGIKADPVEVLQLYTRLEAELEAGPYRPYREVLRGVMAGIASAHGFEATEAEQEALPDSVGDWPPFPDTVEALRRLQAPYHLVIVSNIDDALFAGTARRLEVPFHAVITAEQVRSYKPGTAHFRETLARLGVGPEQILHVAQSLYHDHAPAKALGWRTAWVNRPSRLPGTGLALPVDAVPDLEVPDLRTLADRLVS